mmetsp:Transcript_4526/g.6062  ORF Transcript_4526/g.6062 Transcript_4526/m.6062 type:complete len:336 (-) Transcript_4526:880-1887(-)|eukprot:CAMPEP_0184015168 /NCGR_PEP_ID=MMETSP0954-20121128/6139_1 /TAXON_ID=627963 /ORGANISM="Aplanochytrium sp, Strain PBS07" /LENGTH=335 /DNA_ID=CAMNT_0026295879 /DNA_START=80 /DNA_END=1087 /DNA_ORIENTATION=+
MDSSNGRDKVVILQFRPAWDVQAYLRFCGIRHHIENCSLPRVETTGKLPQLRDANCLIPATDIFDFLSAKYVNMDKRLSELEKAQTTSLRSLILNDLEYALQWSYWGDDEHYVRETKKSLGLLLPFPLNMFLPWYMRRQAKARLNSKDMKSEDDVRQIAKRSYESLSLALGQKVWMFGDEAPTSIDALVFGHLMLAMNEPISEEMNRFPNLIRYCDNIRKTYFEPEKFNQLVSMNYRNAFSESLGFKAVMKTGPMPIPLASKRIPEVVKAEIETEVDLKKKLEKQEFHRNSKYFAAVSAFIFVGYYILQSVQFVLEDEDLENEYAELDSYGDETE